MGRVDVEHCYRSVKRQDLEALCRLAEQGYPRECCGVITVEEGPVGAVDKIHPLPNIADELHALNPDSYPRDARTSYVLGGSTWLGLFRRISEGEIVLKAIYHSHVDTDAFFSSEDRAMAFTLENPPQPIFPEALYIVISVCRGRINQVNPHRAYQWQPDRGDFVEVKLEIEG